MLSGLLLFFKPQQCNNYKNICANICIPCACSQVLPIHMCVWQSLSAVLPVHAAGAEISHNACARISIWTFHPSRFPLEQSGFSTLSVIWRSCFDLEDPTKNTCCTAFSSAPVAWKDTASAWQIFLTSLDVNHKLISLWWCYAVWSEINPKLSQDCHFQSRSGSTAGPTQLFTFTSAALNFSLNEIRQSGY